MIFPSELRKFFVDEILLSVCLHKTVDAAESGLLIVGRIKILDEFFWYLNNVMT